VVLWRDVSWQALARGEMCEPRWAEFGQYAQLRSQGLRQEALRVADRFAAALQAGSESDRWDFTCWVCSQVLSVGVIRSMILPQPIEGVVLQALWDAQVNADARATVWLVRWFPVEVMAHLDFAADSIGDFLRSALSAHPTNIEIRAMLAGHLVQWVRSDTADLHHGRYDGDPNADLVRLREAESLVDKTDPLNVEIDVLRQVVNAHVRSTAAGEA